MHIQKEHPLAKIYTTRAYHWYQTPPCAPQSYSVHCPHHLQYHLFNLFGEQIVEVFFEDQTSYAHLLVKLADMENQTLLDDLSAWMDWTKPGGLVQGAPEGAQFIGGAMEMAEGRSAYLHLDLEPGDYAWIGEIPNPAEHNRLKTFSILE